MNVSIREGLLMITGEKAREDEEKDEKHHRVERVWGRFARAIPLPGPVDTGKTTATFKEGVLTVTLPKTAVAKESLFPSMSGRTQAAGLNLGAPCWSEKSGEGRCSSGSWYPSTSAAETRRP